MANLESDRDIALRAARRSMRRRMELYPNWHLPCSGYARNGVEIHHPYCGGPREGWNPPPGAEYVRATVFPDGTETVHTLHQVA